MSVSLPPQDYTVHGILQARMQEWVAVLFSEGSSQPRDQTQISHMAGRFFTSSATREALCVPIFTQSDQETCLSFHWPGKRIGINVTFYYQMGLNEYWGLHRRIYYRC